MRQLPAERFNVAWFKLAEFVSRGEKERALALFRLLSHSFESKALVYQLEADLLLLFGDEQAIEKYEQAAVLFMHENNTAQAVMLYTHIMSLSSVKAKEKLLSKLEVMHEPIYQKVYQRLNP